MAQIIKKDRVLIGEPVQGGAATRATPPRHARDVELVRIDGRVHAIQMTCSCGEVTLLEIDYDEGAATAADATR